MCVCIPLLALGETLGILHLQDGTIRQDPCAIKRMQDKTQLAKRFANNIGLGISCLKSRESMRNLSLGIAMFPDHGPDPAAVIKAADIALYLAKRGGRDRVVMAGDPLSQGASATPLEPARLQG